MFHPLLEKKKPCTTRCATSSRASSLHMLRAAKLNSKQGNVMQQLTSNWNASHYVLGTEYGVCNGLRTKKIEK
jgi:hypothetical protein